MITFLPRFQITAIAIHASLALTFLTPSVRGKEPVSDSPKNLALSTSPQELTAQLKTSIAKVRSTCVAVYQNGSGSGVIISPDGLVLTAAHMMRNIKEDKKFKITLENGEKAEAKLLGFNRETDFALLQITSPNDKTWPYCKLAQTTATTGEFCFTMAHPSGLLKGRPAQVRLGRVTTHSMQREKPFFLFADCNIQPGDSGGPLFSMDGQLVGLDSSAASHLELNIFSTIDQYYLDEKRLKQGDRWGDQDKAPDGPNFTKTKLNKESLAAVSKEFMRRFEIKYPPTVDFIQSLNNKKGTVELDQNAILKHMPRDVIAIAKNQPLSLGLDDPELTKQLSPLPAQEVRAISIYADTQIVARGIAIDATHILTKASELPKDQNITIRSAKKTYEIKTVATDKTWDLALLKVAGAIKLPAVQWLTKKVTPVKAGDLLKAKDHANRMIWNVATDEARVVTKKRSIGPLKDKSLISKHRAPYPLAIRHALHLYAKDVGTPVFNEEGELIGMHIARFSRTMGLIIPTRELKKISTKLLHQSKGDTHPASSATP